MRILFRTIVVKTRSIARRRFGHLGLTPMQFMALDTLIRIKNNLEGIEEREITA